MRALISWALEDSVTCQYPFNQSNWLTNLADPTYSSQCSLHGRGKESGSVTVSTFLKSVHGLKVLGFFTKKTRRGPTKLATFLQTLSLMQAGFNLLAPLPRIPRPILVFGMVRFTAPICTLSPMLNFCVQRKCDSQ